jgi:hypothetical protein
MSKKIITISVSILLFALSALADTKNNGTGPFSPEADSYSNSVKATFENLPIIADPTKHKIEGTKKIVEAQAQKKLTGKIHAELRRKYDNSKIIGTTKANLQGPITIDNKKIYFWIISGNVQYFYTYGSHPPKQHNETFFYVIHFENNNWKEDCLIVGKNIFVLNSKIQNAAALISEPLQNQKNETLYNNAIKKEKWTFNNREIKGKIVDYKNGKTYILYPNNKIPFQLDVTKFSPDDQILIHGYINHLNIPIRDIQDKKQSR